MRMMHTTHFKILVTFHFYFSVKNPTPSIFLLQLSDLTQRVLRTCRFQKIYTLQGFKIHLVCRISIGSQKRGVKSVIFHDKIRAGDLSNEHIESSGPFLQVVRYMNIIISAQIDFTAQKISQSGQKWILIIKS